MANATINIIKGVVKKIILNPDILDNEVNEISELSGKSEVFVKSLPRNSLIAEKTSEGDNKDILCFPFFSSHFSLPAKIGETIWILDDTSSEGTENDKDVHYYWISRVHGNNISEDANHSHYDRRLLFDYKNEVTNKNDNSIVKLPDFNNGADLPNESSSTIKEDFKSLLNSTNSSLSLKEPIPRYTKFPGEFILQGSNNTLISLGTDRGFGLEDYEENDFNPDYLIDPQEKSGAIDIVAGRSLINSEDPDNNEEDPDINTFENCLKINKEGTSYSIIKNTSGESENLKDSYAYTENRVSNISEGSPDFIHDYSRIYISMNSDCDSKLGLNLNFTPDIHKSYNEDKTLDTQNEILTKDLVPNSAFVTIKSDEIRIISRDNIPTRTDDDPSDGSIILLKEGIPPENFQNPGTRSSIMMLDDGFLSIDGSKILIGNSNLISENNGESNQVFIGHSATEPLVLANKLESRLNEVLDAIKNLADIVKNHTHPTGIGPTGTTADQLANLDSFENNVNNPIREALHEIKSKIAKTL